MDSAWQRHKFLLVTEKGGLVISVERDLLWLLRTLEGYGLVIVLVIVFCLLFLQRFADQNVDQILSFLSWS